MNIQKGYIRPPNRQMKLHLLPIITNHLIPPGQSNICKLSQKMEDIGKVCHRYM